MAGGLIGALGIGALGAQGLLGGNAASQAAQQEVQMRRMENQLKMMQLMQQLQQGQLYQKAFSQASPDEQRAIALGETPSSYEAGQQKKQQAANARQTLMLGISAAIPDIQDASQKAQAANLLGLLANPGSDAATVEKLWTDFVGRLPTAQQEQMKNLQMQNTQALMGERASMDALRAESMRSSMAMRGTLEAMRQQQLRENAPVGGGSVGDPGFQAWLAAHPYARSMPATKMYETYLSETSRGMAGPKGAKESQFDYFVRTHPGTPPADMISAYHAASRETEDDKLKDLTQRLSLEADYANRRADAASSRRLGQLRDEVAEGLKAPPETREQKFDDFTKRLSAEEASAERRGDHASAARLKALRQEIDEGLRARPGGGRGGTKAPTKPGKDQIFNDNKYAMTISADDPTFGIGRLNEVRGFWSRHYGTPPPRLVWMLGGIPVDPHNPKLTKDQREHYAGLLKDHGFTIDQMTGAGLNR